MSTEVRYERVIAASPQRVFEALISQGGQEAFYGTDAGGWLVRSESDVRVGGAWTVDFGPSAEELYRHLHVYEAIEPPARLKLATTETRLDGSTLSFQTEFVLAAHDGGTLLTMVQRGLPTDELRAEHARGVPNAFDRFARFVGA